MANLTNCELITGRQLVGCVRNNVGGIKRVYIANHADVASYTVEDGNSGYTGSTVDQIVDITMNSTKTFFTFDTVKETSSFSQTIETNVQNGTFSFTPTVTLIFNKLDADTRNLIQMLSLSLVDVIIEDMNGQLWLIGKDQGLDLTNAEMGSGVAGTDRNGATLTFTGKESTSIGNIYLGDDSDIAIVNNQITVNGTPISSYS